MPVTTDLVATPVTDPTTDLSVSGYKGIFFGNKKIDKIYFGNRKIQKVFYGNKLIYDGEKKGYLITTSIYYGEISIDDPYILNDKTIYLTPNDGYILPSTISVSGAEYIYNNISGEIRLSNPISEVIITATCIEINAIVFVSNNSFTLKVNDAIKHWNGTIEYSADYSTWNTWAGTDQISSTLNTDNKNRLYLRGKSNTYLTGANDQARRWILTGTDIYCYGNAENMLNYETVANGNHPTVGGTFALCNWLRANTELVRPPSIKEIGGGTLPNYVFWQTFRDCIKLAYIPTITATSIGNYTFGHFLHGCTQIKVANSQSDSYPTAYRIPENGTGTAGTAAFANFLTGTGGSRLDDPTINTTYYTSNEFV